MPIIYLILCLFSFIYAEKLDTAKIFSDSLFFDTTKIKKFYILAPLEIDIQEHINYPIFFISDINKKDEPIDTPPKNGLIVLNNYHTGESSMKVFNYENERDPYLMERRDKEGKKEYKFMYLWCDFDLQPYCKLDGRYDLFVVSDGKRSNVITFKLMGSEYVIDSLYLGKKEYE